MSSRERFGRVLRQLRREKSASEERDVSQAEVARAVGDTQPNVAKWEAGALPKETATVQRLADFYGVSWIWLLHGEGQREPTVTPTMPMEKVSSAKPRKRRRA